MTVRRGRLERLRISLAGLWAGGLACIAAIATPAIFAALPVATAGTVVRRIFAVEAATSLVLGLLLIIVERRLQRDRDGGPALTAEILLPAGAMFCTVAGYYALVPMMAAARAGTGAWSFGALHAASSVLFGLKLLLVLALLWRSTR
jgi:hypothetical protein